MARAVRRAVAEMDKDQPVAVVATMEQLVESWLEPRRLNTLLLGLFAGAGRALSAGAWSAPRRCNPLPVGLFAARAWAVAGGAGLVGAPTAAGPRPPPRTA